MDFSSLYDNKHNNDGKRELPRKNDQINPGQKENNDSQAKGFGDLSDGNNNSEEEQKQSEKKENPEEKKEPVTPEDKEDGRTTKMGFGSLYDINKNGEKEKEHLREQEEELKKEKEHLREQEEELKKEKEQRRKQEEELKKEHQKPREEAERDRAPKKVYFSSLRINQDDTISQERYSKAGKLYLEAAVLANKILRAEPDLQGIAEVPSLVSDLISFMETGEPSLLNFVFSEEVHPVSFLALNSVNVCVLSFEIGSAMKLHKEELAKLGMASFLHTIGMPQEMKPEQLDDPEEEKIKEHIHNNAAMIKKSALDIDSGILEAIADEHEYMDGSGYPEGKEDEQINRLAQVIGFCDVYEALCHDRTYRKAFSPAESMRIILQNKEKFNARIMKLFLERVGLYPRGAKIELSTKEVATVTRHNPRFLLAPRILVSNDSWGERLEKPKEIDLSTTPTVHVARCL